MMEINLSAEAMQQHKAFLRLVHSSLGDHLYIGKALPVAIGRYVRLWLPLVAEQCDHVSGTNTLVPPIDIAWIWHLHRLAPQHYARYCTTRFGRILEPGKAGIFTLQRDGYAQTTAEMEELALITQRLWSKKYGSESFFADAKHDGKVLKGEIDPLSKQTTLHAEVKIACNQVQEELGFDYDVGACSSRQRTFLWQISQPAFEGAEHGDSEDVDAFYSSAKQRYLMFLKLMKLHGYSNHFFVPRCVWCVHVCVRVGGTAGVVLR